jgi:hypothetical protein
MRGWDRITWRLRPCKIWTGHIGRHGYGTCGRGHRGPNLLAHRVALAGKLGRPIRDGYLACHHCDVRACVEPTHLYEGTEADNALDVVERGRWPMQILDAADCDEIRRLYGLGGRTQRGLAAQFGVSQRTIWRVVNGSGGWYDRIGTGRKVS